jgi:O-antigen ligase
VTARRYRLLSTLVWLLAGPILLFPEIAPVLAGGALLVLLIMRLLSGRFMPQTWQRTFLDGFIMVYIPLAITAYAISPLPEHSLPKLTALLWGMAGFYVAQDWLLQKSDIQWLQILLALAAVGVAVISLFTVKWPVKFYSIDLQYFYGLLPGWELVHRNEAAIVLCLLLPFPTGMVRQANGRWRWLAIIGTFFVLAVIFLTQSRAAYLVLAGMVVVYFIWGRVHQRVILGVALVALLVILVIAFWPGQANVFMESIAQIDQATRSGESSWTTRLQLWQAAGQVLQEYPVLGTGLYTFFDVIRIQYMFSLEGFNRDLVHAHNLFLQSGADMGWPGFLLLLLFWGSVIYFLWWLARPGNAPGWGRYARLWGVSVTGYLLFNMVDVETLGNRPGFLLWLVLAGATALVRLAQQTSKESFPSPQRVLVWIPIGVFLLLAPFWLTSNLANIQLDRVLLHNGQVSDLVVDQYAGDPRRSGWVAFLAGEDDSAMREWSQIPQSGSYLAGQGFAAHRDGRLDEALRLYSLSLALAPDNAQVHYWRGLIHEAQGDLSPAEADLERAAALAAVEESEEWNARLQFVWGRILADQGEWPAARTHVEQAIDMQSGRAEYHQLLAQILTALGDPAGAEAALEQAEQLR